MYFVFVGLSLIGIGSISALNSAIDDFASPCEGINWEDHCNPELLPDYSCVVDGPNGTCIFKSMSNKD